MENLEIKVSKKTRMVDLPKQFITVDGENLQSKIIFSFIDEFVKGQARLEYEINNEKKYLALNKENETYTLAVSSILTKEGYINMQLVIDEDSQDETLPVFKSNKFYLYCNPSINAVDEEPESSYELWIQQADKKLNEVDNLNISIKDSVITITNKNGESFSENVKGDKGEKGEPGAVKMQVVDTLPDTGETDTIYLLKKGIPSQQNLYDEYVYTETSGWEHIGDTSVDLTDYYTKVETDERLNNKQDTLTAGDNITIENNVISAKDGALPLVVLPARSISDVSVNDYEGRQIDILSLVKDQIEYAIDNFDGCCLLLFGGDDSSTNKAYTPYTYLLRPSFMYSKKQTRYEWQMTYTSTSIPLNSNELYGNKRIVISAEGTWNGNKFTCTSCNYNRKSAWSYLYINNTKPYTPTNDYNPATKKYVDDNKYTLPVASAETLGGIKLGEGLSADENGVVSASGGKSELYTFYTGINYSFNRPNYIYQTAFSADKQNMLTTMLGNIITDTMTTDNKAKMLLLTFDCSNAVQGLPYLLFTFGDNQKLDTARNTYRMVSIPNGIYNRTLYTYYIDIQGSWENNVFSVSYWQMNKSDQFEALSTETGLSKTNTKSYTPTNDYNPATKKYVDDNKYTLPIASANTLGGIMLGDQYSVDETGTLESNAYLPVLTLYTDRDTMWIGRRHYSSTENYTEGGVYDTVLAFLNKKKYNWFYVREWLTNYSSSMGGTPYHIDYVCLWSKKTDNIYSDGQYQLEFVSSYFSRTRTYTPAYSTLTIRYKITSGVIELQDVTFSGAVDVIPQETLIKTNTTAYTPTGDYNPSTKLYTDKTHYENMTGYDATKTQVLKNVNGTLTWVDEV